MSQGSNCSLSAILDLFDEGVLGDDVYGHDSHSDWTADEPQDKPTVESRLCYRLVQYRARAYFY